MVRINPSGASLPPLDVRAGETLLLRVDQSAITPGVPYASLSFQNILVNGGLDIWQRGNGPFTLDTDYTADRWRISLGAGSAISVVPSNVTKMPNSLFSGAITYTHVALSRLNNIAVGTDWGLAILGKTVSLGGWVYCTTPSAIRLEVSWTGTVPGSVQSAYNTGLASWEYLSANNAAIQADSAAATFSLRLERTAVVYIDNVMACYGVVAQPYVVTSPMDEWERCQRYYEVHGASNNGWPRIAGYAGAGNEISQSVTFLTRKAVQPTLTRNGVWAVTNTGQPTVGSADLNGYSLRIAPTLIGAAEAHTDSADDTITAEANP